MLKILILKELSRLEKLNFDLASVNVEKRIAQGES